MDAPSTASCAKLKNLAKLWAESTVAVGILAEWARVANIDVDEYFATAILEIYPRAKEGGKFLCDIVTLALLLDYKPTAIIISLEKYGDALKNEPDVSQLARILLQYSQDYWKLEVNWIVSTLPVESMLCKSLRDLLKSRFSESAVNLGNGQLMTLPSPLVPGPLVVASDGPVLPAGSDGLRSERTHQSKIDGCEQSKLSHAIESGFPSPKLLAIALSTRLEDSIWNYASLDDEYPIVRSKMIMAYNSQNKIASLVSALINENPTNTDLMEFAWRHQILKRPGGSLGLACDDDSLERMLDPVRGFYDVGQFLQRLGQIVNSVCQIRYPISGGIAYGTGFLIGNSTVLTNWHVVENVTSSNRRDMRLIFDYRTDPDGMTISAGMEFRLVDSDDWLIDHAPYDPFDLGVRTIDEERVLQRDVQNLDYAVLRIAGGPGKKPIGAKPSPSAVPRGFLSLDDVIEVPSELETAVWCFQHPYEKNQSQPQQVDWNKPGLLGINSDQTRVWYNINTRPGSSGAPILTGKLQLFALHQAGGNDWPAASVYRHNRGVPLVNIRNLLVKRGTFASIQ